MSRIIPIPFLPTIGLFCKDAVHISFVKTYVWRSVTEDGLTNIIHNYKKLWAIESITGAGGDLANCRALCTYPLASGSERFSL